MSIVQSKNSNANATHNIQIITEPGSVQSEENSVQIGMNDAVQTAGHTSLQIAGVCSTQIAEAESIQIVGNCSTQTAGLDTLQIGIWQDLNGRRNVVIRSVDKSKANKPFRFEDGEWTEIVTPVSETPDCNSTPIPSNTIEMYDGETIFEGLDDAYIYYCELIMGEIAETGLQLVTPQSIIYTVEGADEAIQDEVAILIGRLSKCDPEGYVRVNFTDPMGGDCCSGGYLSDADYDDDDDDDDDDEEC